MENYKIYMDVCCLNRPFDDLSQDRVYIETEAILTIISHCQRGEWTLVSSGIVEFELSTIRDTWRLEHVQRLLTASHKRIKLTPQAEERAIYFQNHGLKAFDSLHLALAESYGLDVFLTTDDRLLRAAKKIALKIKAMNPVTWLMEVKRDEQ